MKDDRTTRTVFAVCIGWLVQTALLPPPLVGQDAAELVSVWEAADGLLFGTRAAATDGARLAVLTAPSPAVHIFTGGEIAEWGGRGGGPGELIDPSDISWSDAIAILDMGNRKIATFDEHGTHLGSRRLADLWANRIDIVMGDTILGAFIPMADQRAVVRIRGAEIDTLLAYELRGESIRLEAEGAPTFTVKTPFSDQDRWAVAPDGTLVWYRAGSGELRLLDREGRTTGAVPISWSGTEVSSADREWWLANAIPTEFMGRRIFEPIRRVARREVEFPERLPPVIGLEADALEGFWVKRGTSSSGELWRLVRRDGTVAGDLRLPAGRELLAVGQEGLFALARDELDVEFIEVYGRPEWAR